MTKTLIAAILFCVAVPASAAQLYRWVDAQGRVEWRDTPPPASAKEVEQRKIQGNVRVAPAVPYSVQQAVKNFPVTLWTAACGTACDQAKAHLVRRAVPYAEKDAKASPEELKRVTGGLEVPVLFVGRRQLKGYLEPTWDEALDAAGYPRSTATTGAAR